MLFKKSTISIILIILSAIIINAQQVHTFTSSGDIVMIDEFMGIVMEENGKVKITSLNSKDSWPEEYQNLNIELSDEILFVNGKRVKTQKAFEEEYTNIKAGEKVEFGLKRGNERFIVSFKRMDTSKLNRKVMTMPAGGASMGNKKISVENGKIMLDGKEVHPDSLEKMGIKVMTQSTTSQKKDDND